MYGQLIFITCLMQLSNVKENQLLQGSQTYQKGTPQSSACCLLPVGFSSNLSFDPEAGGSTFLRNVIGLLLGTKQHYIPEDSTLHRLCLLPASG
jgi:hypothetical protein